MGPEALNDRFSDCLVNQYNQYTTKGLLADNVTVNGLLTLKENIEDNMGILSAYIAMKKFAQPKKMYDQKVTKGVDSFNDDQLFFLGFAQVVPLLHENLNGMKEYIKLVFFINLELVSSIYTKAHEKHR